MLYVVQRADCKRFAVAADDVAALCLVPGVGRKTAARLLIELKSKLDVPDGDVIVLTDGAGNVAMSHLPPQKEAALVAEQIQDAGIKSIVVNMEHVSFDQGLAQKLADQLGGPCYALQELRADVLYHTVREEMDNV